MPPIIPTEITQHTLWQALSGQIPPLALRPMPVGRAVLDSRNVMAGDLFIALPGQFADGHNFVGQAVERGAGAVICEARGQAAAAQAGAVVVECATGPHDVQDEDLARLADAAVQIAYIVPDSQRGLQQVGAFQRLHRGHRNLRVIGITGSVGKTSTKEIVAGVLANRFATLASPGNLNNEQGLPLTLLGLSPDHERAVLEMGMYDMGEITRLCELGRPHVGVITNVGPSHLERLGTIERIAQAKSELVQALPSAAEGGVAILNWDDERVRPMANLTAARIFRYGLTADADLWAEDIQSAGMEGIRFQFRYREPGQGKVETLHMKVPLLGRHSVHTALRGAAIGLVEGLTWQEIVAGLQRNASQLRLVVVSGHNGSTLIDDTYNASPASTIAALNLLLDMHPNAPGRRRVAVLGDMRELGSYTEEGHKLAGRRAAGVVHLLVTVGKLGRMMGEFALETGMDGRRIHIMEDADSAIALLRDLLQPQDMVLIKGSRAVGMDRIVTELSTESSRKQRI